MRDTTRWAIGTEVRRAQAGWIRGVYQMSLTRILRREQFQSHTEAWLEIWHILGHRFGSVHLVDIAIAARNVARFTFVLIGGRWILDSNIMHWGGLRCK